MVASYFITFKNHSWNRTGRQCFSLKELFAYIKVWKDTRIIENESQTIQKMRYRLKRRVYSSIGADSPRSIKHSRKLEDAKR